MLTQERLKYLFNYDPETGLFTRKVLLNHSCTIDKVGTIDYKGYRRIAIDGKYYRAHRLAFLYMTSKCPEFQVDHKNTIRDDNRWENLREADNAKNQYNRRMKNKTGYKGVSYINGWYIAKIRYKREKIYLGSFKTAEEAGEAYTLAAIWYAGEFKRLD